MAAKKTTKKKAPKKGDCVICLTQEDIDRILGKTPCNPAKAKKTVKRSTTTKTKPKTARKPAKAKKTPKKASVPKKTRKAPVKPRTAPRTASKRKTTVAKAKAKSKAISSNSNTNNVSVSVKSNPRAVSNVYILAPPQQQSVKEEVITKKVERDIPYDAPLLPRRSYGNENLIYPAERPRTQKIYVDNTQKVVQGDADRRRLTLFNRKGKRKTTESQGQTLNTVYAVDYPTAIEAPKKAQVSAPRQAQLSAPKKDSGPVIDAEYTIVPDRKKGKS